MCCNSALSRSDADLNITRITASQRTVKTSRVLTGTGKQEKNKDYTESQRCKPCLSSCAAEDDNLCCEQHILQITSLLAGAAGRHGGGVPSHEGGPAEQLVQSAQLKGCNWLGAALALILPLRQRVQLRHCLAHKPAAVLLPVDLKGTQVGTWERRGNTLRNNLAVMRSDCDSFQVPAVCTVSESEPCKSTSCCYSMHQFAML